MQSAVPRVLEVLDRKHRPGRPEQAVAEARAAGFEHVNLDLIYGAPYETDDDWQRSLDAAIGAGADHISAYALVVEEGTALARQVAQGVVPAPDDDVLADRYVHGRRGARRRPAIDWYEVSNWARSDGRALPAQRAVLDATRTGGDSGPGAHSHVGGVRWWNVKHPVRYAAVLEAGAARPPGARLLDAAARLTERVMLGVRLREGLALRPSSPEPAAAAAAAAGHLGAASITARPARAGGAHPARAADGRRRGPRAARLTLHAGPRPIR